MIIVIDKKIHTRNEILVYKKTEFGGGLEFDTNTGHFKHKSLAVGKFSSVHVPPAVVQFHTHSALCKAGACTLALPSIPDLFGFASAVFRKDASLHCIYTTAGTFCLALHPSIVRASKKQRRRWLKTAKDKFTSIRNKFSVNYKNFAQFRSIWLDIMAHFGFLVSFQPIGGNVFSIPIPVQIPFQ